MAPQRQGNDEDSSMRPRLATSLGGGASSETQVYLVETCQHCVEDSPETAATPTIITKRQNSDGRGLVEDDELTNLTWLQNCNILQSIHTSGNAPKGVAILRRGDVNQLADGDHGDDSCEMNGEGGIGTGDSNGDGSSSPVSGESYNPAVHIYAKPPYSFSCLIFMAIEDSPTKALPVKDIYTWILSHFPYFQNAPTGWKNSVRHNLSLNKCFLKVDRGQNIAKGSLWCVDPSYRPNLLQALRKTPYNQHHHIRLPADFPVSSASNSPMKSVTPSTKPNANVPNPDPEVDAAATMLALKNAPRILSSPGQSDVEKSSNGAISPTKERRQKRLQDRSRSSCNLPHALSVYVPVITVSPSEDHTYSSTSSSRNGNSDSPTSSIDEPFEFGSGASKDPRRCGSQGDMQRTMKGCLDGCEGDSGGDSGVTRSAASTSDEMEELAEVEGEDKEDGYFGGYQAKSVRRRNCGADDRGGATAKIAQWSSCVTNDGQESGAVDDEQKKIAEGADALLNLAGIRTEGGSCRIPRRRRKQSRRNLRHLVLPDEVQR